MTREEIAAVGAHMANFGHLMAYNNFPDNRMKEVADEWVKMWKNKVRDL